MIVEKLLVVENLPDQEKIFLVENHADQGKILACGKLPRSRKKSCFVKKLFNHEKISYEIKRVLVLKPLTHRFLNREQKLPSLPLFANEKPFNA